jgi:hypothetical protein
MLTYFRSNEANGARILSKWLSILMGILTPLTVANVFHGSTLHYICVATNITALAIKLIIPFTGSNDNDLKALKANCNDTVNQTPNK